MTDQQILEKAFKKVADNGFTLSGLSHFYDFVIFSHAFAKAFWGEEYISQPIYYDGDVINDLGLPAWQYHLQQMVLQEDPIKYLENFI